jgi:hypothetical protein
LLEGENVWPTGKHHLANEEKVKRRPQTVKVNSVAIRISSTHDYLWGCKSGRSRCCGCSIERPSYAEVPEPDSSIRPEQEVSRLDIAVIETLLMEPTDASCSIQDQCHGSIRRYQTFGFDKVVEAPRFKEFESDIASTFKFPGAETLHDMEFSLAASHLFNATKYRELTFKEILFMWSENL